MTIIDLRDLIADAIIAPSGGSSASDDTVMDGGTATSKDLTMRGKAVAEIAKVYCGLMDPKEDKTLGVYNSKHQRVYQTAYGGHAYESYGVLYATVLIHWTRSLRETESAGPQIFDFLRDLSGIDLPGGERLQFIMPLYPLQDVGMDNTGVYERAIELACYYMKGK